MSLKQGKTKLAGKCAKCSRDIRVGWTVYYDAENKKVYCKPCGETINQTILIPSQESKSESVLQVSELMGDIRLIHDMVVSRIETIDNILKTVVNLEKQAIALNVAIATKTTILENLAKLLATLTTKKTK